MILSETKLQKGRGIRPKLINSVQGLPEPRTTHFILYGACDVVIEHQKMPPWAHDMTVSAKTCATYYLFAFAADQPCTKPSSSPPTAPSSQSLSPATHASSCRCRHRHRQLLPLPPPISGQDVRRGVWRGFVVVAAVT